jgi:hypothetical protein
MCCNGSYASSIVPEVHCRRTFVAKKDQDQDIQSRLRQLTEQTRRTRRELEDLIKRPESDGSRAFAQDRPQFFRRRRQRSGDK